MKTLRMRSILINKNTIIIGKMTQKQKATTTTTNNKNYNNNNKTIIIWNKKQMEKATCFQFKEMTW